MELNTLIERLHKHWTDKLPFVVYSLPDSNQLEVLLQKDSQTHTTQSFNLPSFIFAPFYFKEEALCIPVAFSEMFTVKNTVNETNLVPIELYPDTQEDKELYTQYVSNLLESIENKDVLKVVASRKKEIPLTNFSFKTLLERIFNLDTTAFRYIWFHPETGLWCGATPEVLFESDGISFATMALAGTQKVNGDAQPKWGEKEIYEQQLVTDAITTNLQRITSILKVSKPKTQKAGSLYHLKTNIKGIINKRGITLAKIANALHPTPAICGSPRDVARGLIKQNENYNREFYTGFLGPIQQQENAATFYVNLRCMKVNTTEATVYVGGGITIDSIIENEWQETQNKTATMLSVLAPML